MQTPRDPYTPSATRGNSSPKKREGLWLLLLLLLVGGGIAWYMMKDGTNGDESTVVATDSTSISRSSNTGDRPNGGTSDGNAQENAPNNAVTADGRCIAGLSKTNVLDVLKQRNFRIDTLGADRFRAVRKTFGADYEVTVVSDGAACVHDLNAWVKADGVLKNAQATQDFFQLFADLPLQGANPDSTIAWMNDNSTLPEASMAYGKTRFTMAAPDRNTRVLRVLSSDVEVAHN